MILCFRNIICVKTESKNAYGCILSGQTSSSLLLGGHRSTNGIVSDSYPWTSDSRLERANK